MDAKLYWITLYYKSISTLDVFPTIAQLIGVDLPENVTYDGYSMYDWIFTKLKNNNNNENNENSANEKAESKEILCTIGQLCVL